MIDLSKVSKMIDFGSLFGSLFGTGDILGIDVGSSLIKGVQLKNGPGKWSLSRWFIIPIPEEAQTGEISPFEKKKIIVDVIKNYISDNKIKIKNVASSVSGSSVIVRYVSFRTPLIFGQFSVADQTVWP